MWQRKKELINYNNKHENEKRVQHEYKVGQYADILRGKNYRKVEGEKLGPLKITQVHTSLKN